MLNTPTPRHAIVPPSASTITSQTSLRPMPRAYVHSPGTTDTPATSIFPSPGPGDDAPDAASPTAGLKSNMEKEKSPEKGEGDEKAYGAHRQSLPWGKAILGAQITDTSPLSATLASPVSHTDAYPHPTPDFSRKATATPDSYKYSPTAEAIARYAMSDSDDAGPLHRQFIAYGTPTTAANSVDSTPGTEMAPDRLFYKAPKASSTALGSVTGTPGLGVVEEYPVPPVPPVPAAHAHMLAQTSNVQGMPQVVVGTAISADPAITSTATGGEAVVGASMGMSRSTSSSHAPARSPSLGAQTVGMSVQASASSSALPYLSPTLGSDPVHAFTTSNTDYPTRLAPAAVVRSPDSSERSLSPTKQQSSHPQAQPLMRSSSSTSDRPGAIYEHSPSHSSVTGEGLLTEALAAGESIWDPKIYMLVAAPIPSSTERDGKRGMSHAERKKRHWEAYDHPILRSRREKDKQATFDELAGGRVGWREWLWPVPPAKPDTEKQGWRRKDRRRTRRAARARKVQRDRAAGKVRVRTDKRSKGAAGGRRDEDDEEEEEVVLSGRDWSKVKIDGYRPAPPPPSSAPASKIGRTSPFSSSIDSPLTDLAHSASRLESALHRSGSSSSQSRSTLASTSAMRRESELTLASSHSRGSISSDVTDFTIRSAGSHGTAGTGGTARRVPPPTPPPVGPLPAAPRQGSGNSMMSGQNQRDLPQRAGSATGHHTPMAVVSPSKAGVRTRTGSFGAGTALRSGTTRYGAEGEGLSSSPRMGAGAGAGGLSVAQASGPASYQASPAPGAEGEQEKLTPAERRRRMRGKVAAVDLGMSLPSPLLMSSMIL